MKNSKLFLAMALVAIVFVHTVNAQVTVTGSTGANATYTSLGLAFTAINGTAQTDNHIIITVTASTTESASAVLNAGAWSALIIYPTTTGLTISGNLETPLIDLDGADNVTIDGRVNATGSTKDLVIVNTRNSATPGTSTIRFINDATTNTVKYCTLKGSSYDATAGILFFSTTTGATGNDGNTIDNNNITSFTDLSRPMNAVYSDGTAAKTNSGNTISNNNFYDLFYRSGNSYGVYLKRYNTGWTISANSFYETTAFNQSGGSGMRCIGVLDLTSSDITISGNFIGGSAPGCGGTAWTKTSASANSFCAILLYIGPTVNTTTSVEGNTIKNFSWSDDATANSYWTAIYAAGTGDINIGTVTGNTIGATTGTGSVYLYTKATSGNNYGIDITFCTGTVDCRNNTIGAITTNTSNAMYPNNFYGIHKSATAGTTTISNNTIGSTSTANSINAASGSGSFAQEVFGIYSEGTGMVSISGNTISKLTNATNNPTYSTAGKIIGIQTISGTNTISNNTVRDLTIANGNTARDATASVIGIAQTSTTAAAQTVTGNTISNLSNTFGTFGGAVTGLYYAGPATASTASGNFIHSLTAGPNCITGAALYGMYIKAGTTTYSNNIISLGDNSAINVYGIQESNGTNNFYFNTVYIGGSPTTGGFSSVSVNSNSNNARNIRNNLFINARSNNGATGLHYGGAFNTSSLTIDYNDYIASGTGGVLGVFGGLCYTLDDIKAAYQNANSLNTDPAFAGAGGTLAANYIPLASLPGVSGTGITTDYAGATRAATPAMGAYEPLQASVTWTGAAGTDWNTPGNWSPANVPFTTTAVTIPNVANKPVVNQATETPAICNNMNIEAGAVLTIASGKALTVNGTLTNSGGNAGLVIESGGSLMHNSNTVAATVKWTITGSATLTSLKYHFVSIPTQYAAPTTSLLLGSYLYELDPNQLIGSSYGKWVVFGSSSSTPLPTNKGYMIYYPGDSHEYTFTGNLNNGTYNYSLTGHSGVGIYTFNLIPNPYPSSIVWNTAGAGWTTSPGIGGTCYIWSAANGNYSSIASSPTSYIPVGQALMVLATNEATPTLSVNNSARAHSSQAFYKSGGIANQLTIKATANDYADETVVHFIGQATEGFDLQVDGMKMPGLDDAPQLYTVSAGEKFSISNLPEFPEQATVPVNFETKYTGNVTLTFSQIESFPATMFIKLEDKLTGQMINLRQQSSYAFAHQPGNAAERFVLHFGGATGVEEPGLVRGKIWIFDKTVNIWSPATAGEKALVEIFNTAGQVVFSKWVMLSELTRIPVTLSGIAVLRVTTSKEVMVKKGFFKYEKAGQL